MVSTATTDLREPQRPPDTTGPPAGSGVPGDPGGRGPGGGGGGPGGGGPGSGGPGGGGGFGGGPGSGEPAAPAPARRVPRWLRVVALVIAIPLYLAISVVYVRGSSSSTSTVEAAGDHTLPVSGAEMRFDSPLKIEPGWTTIAFRNDGGLAHQASIYRLHDGISGNELAQSLRADRDSWQGKADPVGGVGGIPAGKTQQVSLDLAPGEYLITCFLRGGSASGDSHVKFGMSRVLDVQPGNAAQGSPPATTGEFQLRDDTFGFPDGFDGHGVFKVSNAGTQPHELSIVRLGPGKTVDDFTGFMQAAALAEEGGPKPSGAPPFTNAGGFTILDPGMSGVMMIDLEPGSYVAADFIPDPTKGNLPHFALGLLKPFTVTH